MEIRGTDMRPEPPEALPRLASRMADASMMVLAIVLGGGSLALFAWPGWPTLVPLHLSSRTALAWNALLSLIFFLQHSIMVRRPVRARLSAVIPERYDGAFYAITSGLALAFFVVMYQREGPPLYVLHGLAHIMVTAASLFALAVFVWAIQALDTFDPFGLRPVRSHLRGGMTTVNQATQLAAEAFVVSGPFRWVRHPIYSAIVVFLWAAPQMNASRLELAVLWTAYIFTGAVLEERDLAAKFGAPYRRYCNDVPMLIPWRRPAQVESHRNLLH